MLTHMHKPTHGRAHTEICNYCFSTAIMVLRTRLGNTLYVHCLACYRGGNGSWRWCVRRGGSVTVTQSTCGCVESRRDYSVTFFFAASRWNTYDPVICETYRVRSFEDPPGCESVGKRRNASSMFDQVRAGRHKIYKQTVVAGCVGKGSAWCCGRDVRVRWNLSRKFQTLEYYHCWSQTWFWRVSLCRTSIEKKIRVLGWEV